MIYRNFSKNGQKISLLGMGCMRLPGGKPDNRNLIDIEKTRTMIDHAIHSGINYFDTGYAYHGGNSERALGEILKNYPRDSYYLADKLPVWMVKEEEDAEKILNEQLSRLQTDYIDFYLLHGIRASQYESIKNLKLYEFLKNMQKKGIIKHIGFSFHDTPEALKDILDMYEFEFAQIQYNYFDRYVQRSDELYEILKKANVPAIIMEPVRGGFLASLNEETELKMKSLHPDWSIASWAVRFVAGGENTLCVLSGMTDMDQLNDNIKTVNDSYSLGDKEAELYKEAYENILKLDIVPCTRCRYCMDCPSGVQIPTILNLHNEYILANSMIPYRNGYMALDEKSRADSCIGCRQCEELCPQQIEISKHMERIGRFWRGRSW